MRKQKTESITKGSDLKIKSAIIKDFDSTIQKSVHTLSARVSPETSNSDQTVDDLNSVCVKIETDAWSYTAVDFYSLCSKSEQVLWEERHPDCNKQYGFNLVHEQTGCLNMEQDFTKQDGFTSDCVKSEPMECEVMHQDVTRQARVNSACVNKNKTANSNAYTAEDELNSVSGKTKQSVNPNADQSYTTGNELNTVCDIAKKYINTVTENGNTTAIAHSALCDQTYSKTPENQAKLGDLNSISPKREEIEISNVDQYCARPTVCGETIKIDHFSKRYVPRHSNFDKDDSVIFIERDKRKSNSYPSTHPAPKRVRGQGQDSSSDVVQPMCDLARENAVTRTVPLFPKPAEIKLNERGDQVKEVKTPLQRMKGAKTPEKDKTEYSLQERNLVSCMILEPPENDHFLYCVECNKGFQGDCPVHGPYNYIQDKEVPKGGPLKAYHTSPDCLEIKPSKIAGAGLGVFSKEGLESRILFGPYGGDIITDNHTCISGYCWQIYKDGKPSHFVDAQNKATSNWMRYVNCAMTEADRNLVALQYKRGIYYSTLKPVSPGEELLVWYGDKSARELALFREKSSNKNDGHLKRHMRIHTREKPYKCDVCGYECNQSSLLKTHMRIHTGEKPYKCEVCGYACNWSCDLKKHMRVHTGEKPYTCEVCGYACSQNRALKPHMRKHTGERPYKCEVCGYACTQIGNLKAHMRIHTGERLYTCEVCGYACTQIGNLKAHMRIHTGERPYKCEVCGYSFKQSNGLKTHMRIHTGEKPYKCEVCGYACNQSSTLETHMRIHTGEKPHMCEVCGYSFKQSNGLKTHMRIHTGEKPYKCEVCGYACNQSSTLKTHMRIHTGEKPHTCEVCGYACNCISNLKTHMRIHTGEKP